jgi:hypothetical protein
MYAYWGSESTFHTHLMKETEPVSETLCRYFLYVLGLCAIVCCVFCIGNLAPLHVVICEWSCHLLPPVFSWLQVFVCVCPGRLLCGL